MCELVEKHGDDLGTVYKNLIACAWFVNYISKAELDTLACVLHAAKAKLYSIQAESTSDYGNIEDKLFMVV